MPDPTPCVEQVLAAVAAALTDPPLTLGGTPVPVGRAPGEAAVPRVDLVQLGLVSDGATSFSGVELWSLTLMCVVHAGASVAGPAAPGGADRDAATQAAWAAALAGGNGLRAAVHRALMRDPTLGGRVQDLRPEADPPPDILTLWAADPGAVHVGTYTLDFDTVEGDPFTFAA